MPKQYKLHACGVHSGLKHAKRGMAHFINSFSPVRHVVVTGSGAHRRLEDSERPMEGSGSMVVQPKRQLRPLNFKF